jgi:hypothetical protein
LKDITGMSFISDKTGFVSTIDGQLYKTSDGGATCIPVDKKDIFLKELFFVNENQGFVCTPAGIYITLDGGYTMIEEYTVDYYHSTYNFEFPSPTVGYAIGHDGLIIKRKISD